MYKNIFCLFLSFSCKPIIWWPAKKKEKWFPIETQKDIFLFPMETQRVSSEFDKQQKNNH